ncbi:hypothetical protein LSUB1_G006592 [Lachnellula subtilissima]|uniref:DUF427 domain-containing protein n=1 Tax=Lachnellula subtilissima TaxID=602034 RepID=A0A8H8U930_9HELO|nr:hypothetical protein LSUB1_G006592 [Lachnellula subtilissima]
MADLLELGEKLTTKGPHKIEATPRRVRGLLGGLYVFDTLEAKYVWEHPYYPYFYIPLSAFTPGVLTKTAPDTKNCYWLGTLTSGTSSTSRVLAFDPSGPLENLVRIEVSALDAWFVEDEKQLGPHPKDPYKRVECIPSSREVRIEVAGTVVARSSQNVFLYETMLRTRYYVSAVGVEYGYLRPSETESYCPYKGMANYYNLVVDGKEIKDAVWYYKYPTAESALVAGRLCFYNEKVDVFVDGVKEEK